MTTVAIPLNDVFVAYILGYMGNLTYFCLQFNEDNLNRIKVVLAEKQRTNRWLAEQMGKSENTISRWCSNKSQPSLDMLVKVAELLNVDPRQLINGKIKI